MHAYLKFKIRGRNSNQAGVAVIISILLVGILLSIVLVTSLIFIPKIRTAGEVKKSTAAIYAAESAIEWCLYVNMQGPASLPVMSNGAYYVNAVTDIPPVAADCATPPIKIIGTYQGVSRAFEVSGF